MKNSNILLILTLCFQLANAQDFKATEKYTAKSETSTKQQEYNAAQIHIMAMEDTSKKIATVAISDLDFFEELRITVLDKPNLKDIREVVKVELEYIACCAHTETYYYLATDKGDFIALPSIGNTYCDVPQPSIQYVFPTQKFGKKETILKTKIQYSASHTIKDLEVIQSFAWNDDDFVYEDAVSAIH